MTDTSSQEVRNYSKPADENAQIVVTSVAFTVEREKDLSIEYSSRESSLSAMKSSPLSTELEGVVIKAEDGGNPNKENQETR